VHGLVGDLDQLVALLQSHFLHGFFLDGIDDDPSGCALADLIAADHRYVAGAAVTLGVGVAVTVTGALLLRSARRPAVAVDWTPTGWSLVGTF
jgi:hypothetical protein